MQAFEDFERASKLEPGNTFLREKIQKAKETIAAIAQKKKDSTAKYVYHASDQATLSLTFSRSDIDPDIVVVLLGNRNIKVNKGVLDWMGDTSLVGLDVEVTRYTHAHTHTHIHTHKLLIIERAGCSGFRLPALTLCFRRGITNRRNHQRREKKAQTESCRLSLVIPSARLPSSYRGVLRMSCSCGSWSLCGAELSWLTVNSTVTCAPVCDHRRA
jgi:hypothetical protein